MVLAREAVDPCKGIPRGDGTWSSLWQGFATPAWGRVKVRWFLVSQDPQLPGGSWGWDEGPSAGASPEMQVWAGAFRMRRVVTGVRSSKLEKAAE